MLGARVVRQIRAAFRARARPRADAVFESPPVEVDGRALESLARRASTWDELPQDVLADNPLALAFMSPEAFAWFLPAYMILSIERYVETDMLTGSVIARLTPPDPADAREFEQLVEHMRELDLELDESASGCFSVDDSLQRDFDARVALLGDDERAAVRDYLRYVEAEHGADFPVFGPQQALARFWAHTSATTRPDWG